MIMWVSPFFVKTRLVPWVRNHLNGNRAVAQGVHSQRSYYIKNKRYLQAFYSIISIFTHFIHQGIRTYPIYHWLARV